jgi:hypothetical protein
VRLEVTLDCIDPGRLAEFWTAALDYVQVSADDPYISLGPRGGGPGIPLVLQRVSEPKTAKLRMHLDLYPDDVAAEVTRLGALGAIRVGEHREAGERWVLMRDPEGNEFCVCEEIDSSGEP